MARVGDMVYLHDRQTNASRKNRMRWCMVIARSGSRARVAPRSTTVPGLVFTPAGYLPEFDKPGWFSRWDLPVSTSLIDSARNIGQLPEPARGDVLALFARGMRV